jgi:hypothetical protein
MPDVLEIEFTEAAPHARRCSWSGCKEPARLRQGPRGPIPRWCQFHTRQRKLEQDRGKSKPREPYQPCCKDWQADANPAHTGLCPQCRDFRIEIRIPVYPMLPDAVVVLTAELGTGWQACSPVNPKGWSSLRGPYEGRTISRSTGEVINLDPQDDEESVQWLKGNPGWQRG